MFDITWIRDNPAQFDAGRARRSLPPLADEILKIDQQHRAALTALQEAQSRRNALSQEIGRLKKSGGEAAAPMAEVATLKEKMAAAQEQAERLAARLQAVLASEPNLPAEDVPDGKDERDNRVEREVGTKPAFSFMPRQHFELGETLGQMDFAAAAILSGARFVVLRGQLARLERALGQFMLDLHTGEFGYTEVAPPLLVRHEALFGTGQLPKFAEDLFQTTQGLWLIPTAEVSLTNLAAERILSEKELPLRFTALTPCFRSEAGAAGRDTRGMIRQHQFHKVELVSITAPEQSESEHLRMTECAEEVLRRLGLAYRVVTLSTGDMGFSARKTYDIEVWLPGVQAYREISSCSNCGDFQARRMNARYRPENGKGTRFVHSLNGSALAVGRCLIAIMENYQEEDGSIAIPAPLRPYMGGIDKIHAR
ncbi:MAG TPA: serine--tRNA ligase [Dongiaceae bacterium]|jgi:seryl-tRNA synthetase|nr:serine--tRNA ligase [Dongiaceae bacterium]